MGSGQEWSSEDQRDIVILSSGYVAALGRGLSAYGLVSIRRLSNKSAVAVEIDFTWSFGFVSVELGRLPKLLSCSTLLICPVCSSKV
ncbi:hypothetical protein Tco_1074252 [Tanacetum coccineum]